MPGRTSLLLAVAALAVACTQFKGGGDDPSPEGGTESGPGSDSGFTDSGTGSDSGQPADSGGSRDSSPSNDSGQGDDSGPPACDGSMCGIQTVLSGMNQGGTLAVDGTNVYVEDQGTTTGVVYQCPKSGCTTLITLGPGYATGIATDSQNVYWNDFSAGTVVRCAIGGCQNMPTVIAPNQPHSEGVSFDGTNLYWASTGNVLTCVAPGCGSMSILANGQSTLITGTSPEAAVVYWISNGAVLGCAAGGCNQMPTNVTSGLTSGQAGNSLVVKDGFAYFVSGNAIVSCPVTSTCAFPHTIGSSSAPFGLATDGSDVYWLDENIAQLYRCPVVGCTGSAEVFADQTAFDPSGEIGANVALDGEYVYWADPVSVYRKHK